MRINVQSLWRAVRSIPEREIFFWPGSVGRSLRKAYWRERLGSMGSGCAIDVGVIIEAPEHVFLGDNVWLDNYVQIIAGPPAPRENLTERPNPRYRGKPGEIHLAGGNHVAPFCVLQGHGGLWLGRDVGVAAHSAIYSLSNHYRAHEEDDYFDGDYDKLIKFSPLVPPSQQALVSSPVVFEDGAALGLSCSVLPGATVGRYSWIGAGSVVHGAVPEGVIAGGNPLRVLKQRFKTPTGTPHG
jgi:acetyltransferase-like isoleucine patch superfamily enzyme